MRQAWEMTPEERAAEEGEPRPTPRQVLHGAFLQWWIGKPVPPGTFGDFAVEALADEGYEIIDAIR